MSAPTLDLTRAKGDIIGTISRYIDLRKKGDEFVACCPFHDEGTPSFTVTPATGFFYCFGCGEGGDAIDFVQKYEGVGFSAAVSQIIGNYAGEASPVRHRSVKPAQAVDEWKLIAPIPNDAPPPNFTFRSMQATRTWLYRNAAGGRIGYVCRFDKPEGGKEVVTLAFWVNTSTGEMLWRFAAFPKLRPLYGLDRLANNPRAQVLIVEGEKAADAAQALYGNKLVVVSWPGGGKAVKYADWSPLKGRRIGLWPDADQKVYPERHEQAGELMPFIEQPGTAAMMDVASALDGLADSVRFIMPPEGVPDGWDLADEQPQGFDLMAHSKSAALPMAEFLAKHGLSAAPAPAAGRAQPAADTRATEVEVIAAPAANDRPAPAIRPRTVQVAPGELPAAVDQAEAVICEQCPDIFQRAGAIVRPVRALVEVAGGSKVDGVRLSAVSKHHLAERLTAAATWEKYDKRTADYVPIDCPLVVAETYLARDGSWRLPVLSGILNAPTLRADGSILSGAGYDAATGLLLMGDQSRFPEIPAQPSQESARAALDRLKALVDGFPFVNETDKSVALSAILTACIRRSILTAPMHCFSAPTAGSGKSTLVDVASIIATGQRAAVMSQGRDEAEQEKRLAAALLAGDAVISIDNATQPIDGDLLCQAMTQESVRVRPLGASELRTMPTNAFFAATGNCLLLQGDMTRRALLCSLDPQCERPELRTFDCNPLLLAAEDRGQYLCDALTVLRAFHMAGRPKQPGVSQLGSFEVWSDWVRSALVWLGEADPVVTMDKARKSDPKLEAITSLMAQWSSVIGDRSVTVREVIGLATEQSMSYVEGRASFLNEDLREALLTVAGNGGVINSRSLGKWLAANKERIIGLPADGSSEREYRRFIQGPLKHKVATWTLQDPSEKKQIDNERPI